MASLDPTAASPGVPVATWVKRILGGALLVFVGFAGWTGIKFWQSWNSLDRLAFNLDEVKERLPPITPPADGAEEIETFASVELDDAAFNSFLIVGSDQLPGGGGARADVILLFLFPEREAPAIVSLPRDLYVENPCTGQLTRINSTFNGCEDISGPELLGLTVSNLTGVEVDHFALFDFEGFKDVIDDVGGVTICVDNRVRDFDARLDLPAGCTEASGTQALAWVRTRKTQELVNGSWRAVPGQSDLTRNQHQQDVIFQLFERMKQFGSLGDLSGTVGKLGDAFTVDDDLSIPSAIDLAWNLRALGSDDFLRIEIPVTSHTTSAGADVLLMETSFTEVLESHFPTIATAAVTARSVN